MSKVLAVSNTTDWRLHLLYISHAIVGLQTKENEEDRERLKELLEFLLQGLTLLSDFPTFRVRCHLAAYLKEYLEARDGRSRWTGTTYEKAFAALHKEYQNLFLLKEADPAADLKRAEKFCFWLLERSGTSRFNRVFDTGHRASRLAA